ncbi:Fatty-acid and retinol-binding protein 3 [Aphelenchoides bicaudatus]|nr:Fatty-acid and retinol-binding protein 3 [Aphelenchoides bicaudatus]
MRLLLITGLVIVASIHFTNAQFVQAPEQLSGLLPSELITFYNSLTPRQEKIMDQAVSGNDGNEEGFLSYIRRKDKKLGQRAEHVFRDFIDRLTKLKPDAQIFYLALFNGLRQVDDSTDQETLKKFTRALLYKWVGMKRSSRHSLAVHFPSVAHALNSQKVRDFAEFNI